MKKLQRLLPVLLSMLLALSGTTACTTAVELDDKRPPVTLDPGILSGHLENGFRYYLRSTNSAVVNDRLELRLVVKAGSLDESPDQRGFAHLIEHMAYRGTRSFSEKRIESLLRDNGLRWGDDVNATTHYGATVYRFSLHESDEHLLPVLLSLMAEWLDSIEFDESALAKEKRIVDAELHERYTARGYTVDPVTLSAYSSSRYSNRHPAGDVKSTHSATSDQLRQFWESNYQPDNAVLIMAGGTRPWLYEPMIESAFSDLTRQPEHQQEYPERSFSDEIEEHHSPAVNYYDDGTLIELLSSVDPTLALPELSINLISGLQSLPVDVASSIVSIKSRFQSQLLYSAFSNLVRDRIVSTTECSAVKLESSLLESGQAIEHITLSLTEDSILPCLSVAFDAVRTVQKSKLTEEEFYDFKKLFEQISLLSIEQYRSRNASLVASGLVDMATNGEAVLSVWDMQNIFNEVVASLDRETLNSLVGNITRSHKLVISAVVNSNRAVPVAEIITGLSDARKDIATRIPATVIYGDLSPDQTLAGLLTSIRSPELGRSIASLMPDDQLIRSMPALSSAIKVRSHGNYHEWRLANGAVVVLLQDPQYDHVSITGIADGGYAGKTGSSAVAAWYLPKYLSVNGVNGFSSQSLRAIMRQSRISVEPFTGPLHHGINASGVAEELSSMLSMISGYFEEPLVIEPNSSLLLEQLGERQAATDWPGAIGRGMVADSNQQRLNNQLFIESKNQFFSSTKDFGFIVVGNLSPEQLEPELYYLITDDTARPLRSSSENEPGIENSVELHHREKITDVSVSFSCTAATASGITQMDSLDVDTISSDLSLRHWRLLADIVTERLRYSLREKLGFVYEISNKLFVAKQQLVQQIDFSIHPELEQQVLSAIADVTVQIATKGISQQEFDAALARDERYRVLDAAVYETRSMELAKQWLYNGELFNEESLEADLAQLNNLVPCLHIPDR